jgi:1-acyl-sn-glycerol-3-phosphate acyltransferase
MRGNLIYRLTIFCVRIYARIMLKFDVHWHGGLPSGPKLFVANHPSATDPFVLSLLPNEHLTIMLSGKAFSMPLFGPYLRYVEQICVESGSDSLELAQARLRAGRSVIIFPEGWISPEVGHNPPHSGAARLALETGASVIPIGVYLQRNRRKLLSSRLSGEHTEALWYFRGPYFVNVGEPIRFSGDASNKELVQKVTGQIMQKIESLAKESEHRFLTETISRVPAGHRDIAESAD